VTVVLFAAVDADAGDDIIGSPPRSSKEVIVTSPARIEGETK